MKTLIAYATKYGTAEACAKLLAQALKDGADLANLSAGQHPNPADYDAVVVGGSIYAGMLRRQARHFCKKYKKELLKVRFGCFLCKASPPQESQDEFGSNFDSELLAHAAAKSSFGGEVKEEKLGFWDKLIMGTVAKRGGGMRPPHIDKEKIRSFALAMELKDRDYKLDDTQ